jgi:septal ring factor EnvC (AmiA/AmiB activator)
VKLRATPGLLSFALLLALASLLAKPGWAEDDEEQRARSQLQLLKREITALGKELQEDKRERGSLRNALRDSEIAIGRLLGDIKQTRTNLQEMQAELAKLEQQRQQLLIARGEQQEQISRDIQTAYQLGRQGQLKVLLNQEQPDTLARAMAYYDYFFQARNRRIDEYLGVIRRIDEIEPEIKSTAEQLERTRERLDQQRQVLVGQQAQRQQDLAMLNASITDKDGRLRKMSADREELERLLTVIQEAIAELDVPDDYQDFLALKGQMPYPVTGKASNRYGRRRGDSSLRWQGFLIPAEEGSTVSAIHHGRVVFADWFRGSGLLLIVDHGDGYMSLYGHNQTLLREVGEWVSAGTAISTVGNSGGQQKHALYFEIRANGKPTDPGAWLRRG